VLQQPGQKSHVAPFTTFTPFLSDLHRKCHEAFHLFSIDRRQDRPHLGINPAAFESDGHITRQAAAERQMAIDIQTTDDSESICRQGSAIAVLASNHKAVIRCHIEDTYQVHENANTRCGTPETTDRRT
jgi:hypothetical protein